MPSVKTLLNKTLGKADLLAGLPVHPSQLHSENIFQGAKEWKIEQSEFGLGFFFFFPFWVKLFNCSVSSCFLSKSQYGF